MKSIIKTLLPGIALLALVFATPSAHACSVCMGGADSTVAPAANGAIFLMLGVIGSVLACVAGLIFHLARRSRLSAQASPAVGETLSMISEEQHA